MGAAFEVAQVGAAAGFGDSNPRGGDDLMETDRHNGPKELYGNASAKRLDLGGQGGYNGRV